jgi:hypothetical protein
MSTTKGAILTFTKRDDSREFIRKVRKHFQDNNTNEENKHLVIEIALSAEVLIAYEEFVNETLKKKFDQEESERIALLKISNPTTTEKPGSYVKKTIELIEHTEKPTIIQVFAWLARTYPPETTKKMDLPALERYVEARGAVKMGDSKSMDEYVKNFEVLATGLTSFSDEEKLALFRKGLEADKTLVNTLTSMSLVTAVQNNTTTVTYDTFVKSFNM